MEAIASRILLVRGRTVLLDADLAKLYGVETRILVRNVNRNRDRFPPDFSFQLTVEEWGSLRSHVGISKGRGGRRHLPHVFTEHGALMASSVLNSPTAVQVGLQVVRAFVRLRQLLATNADLSRRVAALEKQSGRHEADVRTLAAAFQRLVETKPSATRGRRIGFATEPRVEEGTERRSMLGAATRRRARMNRSSK